ncbi:MAG: glycosyltransferase family 2 protein [Vibrio splendidus]
MMIKTCSITITFNPDLPVLEKQISVLSSQVSKLVIVDNGSKNINEIADVSQKYDVELIVLGENLGIAEAQNTGIKCAIQYECSHVILFDHDSLIQSDFVAGLLNTEQCGIQSGLKVAAVGPNFNDPRTNSSYSPLVKKWSRFLNGFTLNRHDFSNYSTPFIQPYFLIASGCLININHLKDIGLMRSDFFIDAVDSEWSFRAVSKGYSVLMSTSVSMTHTVGDDRKQIFGRQFSIHSNFRRYFNLRNNIYLLGLGYFSWTEKIRMLTLLGVRSIIGLFYSDDKIQYISYFFKSIKHGFTKKLGPLK